MVVYLLSQLLCLARYRWFKWGRWVRPCPALNCVAISAHISPARAVEPKQVQPFEKSYRNLSSGGPFVGWTAQLGEISLVEVRSVSGTYVRYIMPYISSSGLILLYTSSTRLLRCTEPSSNFTVYQTHLDEVIIFSWNAALFPRENHFSAFSRQLYTSRHSNHIHCDRGANSVLMSHHTSPEHV